jgi:flagellar assembly protein FliH
LRAVRLLPDVVKIGVEPETALPSIQEEEQLSNKERFSSEEASPDAPDAKGPDGGVPDREISNGAIPGGVVPGGAVSAKKEPLHAELLKKSNERIAALEAQLSQAKGETQALLGKVASLEKDLAGVKNASAQKEREMNASVDAAREQARAEGKKQGHAEGLQSGREAGLAQARTEVQEQYREKFSGLSATLEGVSTRLEEHFAELTALNQPRMLRLWQEMLKKMLQRETSLAPDAVLKVLSDVLSRLSDKNHILIYASPEDLKLLQDRLQGEFGDVLRGAKHLELKPDANVDKGSCLVETNLGVYDARWRTQFEQIDAVVEKLFQQLGKTSKAKEPRAEKVRKNGQAGEGEKKRMNQVNGSSK